MSTAHKETYRGCEIRLEYDSDPESPRDWDNLGRMVCWHRRYNLGDEQPSEDAGEYLLDLARKVVSSSYPEALLIKNRDAILAKHYAILPLYLYDHSGITISTGPFSCPWDSGQVGFIYCTLEKAKENWMLKGNEGWDHIVYPEDNCPDCAKGSNLVGKTLRQCTEIVLEGEVQTYDDYLTGQVACWIAEDPNGETIEAVGGYFPDHGDHSKEWDYPIGEARAAIDRWCDEQDTEKQEAQHWAERDVITVQ
jgi:hypothetical protein